MDRIFKLVPPQKISFVLGDLEGSSRDSRDLDLYVVQHDDLSSVEMYFDENGRWVEIFFDSTRDLMEKIANVDEISINFICSLPFVWGDRRHYEQILEAAKKCKSDYNLPEQRRNLLRYRVHVLYSKYLGVSPSLKMERGFFCNAINYPLIQLIMDSYGVFPESPKLWMQQLKESIPTDEFNLLEKFILGAASDAEVSSLVTKYTKNLKAISLKKPSQMNRLSILS